MATKGKDKSCFVIGPIGSEKSPERIDADWLLRGIIEPILKNDPFNYVVQRADQMPEPGVITSQVIDATIEADLVIADLTGANPNAFYELAIRHMEQKAVIHLAKKGERLPFDVADYRAVMYSREQYEDLEKAKAELAKQVEAIESPAYKPGNPITKARGWVELERSADTKDKLLADLAEGLQRLDSRLGSLEASRNDPAPGWEHDLLEQRVRELRKLQARAGSRIIKGIGETQHEEYMKLIDETVGARLAADTVTAPDEEGES